MTKKVVEIPSKLVPDYFEKFIKDIAKKVDITATGFEVITRETIHNCTLQLVHDFFKNSYFIGLLFDYNGYMFDATKSKNTHSEIDLKDLNNIQLVQYKRAEAENNYTQALLDLGLSKNENNVFELTQNTTNQDTFATIQWAIENKEKLASLGFSLENLKIDGKKIDSNAVTIQCSNTIQNDWFDIKMIVVCDDFEFNFSELLPNIKNKNRLFALPNGNSF